MLRTVNLTTLTAAGSSVSNDVIAGEFLGAYVAYEGAGTLTLTTQHAPVVTFLTMATGGTQWYYPRGTACTTGAAARVSPARAAASVAFMRWRSVSKLSSTAMPLAMPSMKSGLAIVI